MTAHADPSGSQSGEWRPGRPPRTIGPYLVERQLGAGRMGTVFLARHPEVDARYAIKVLAADLLDAKDVLRFQREVELLAAAPRHPSLVRVHAAGQERGRSYFVMEFVEGETLQEVIGRRGVDPRAAARWISELAGALAALHGVGIIHRDIKPANILVDPQGRARLADFGLARQLGESAARLTRTGEVMGTPQYMAPEQALGLEVGPPTDVYALGMVLYSLLAGSPAVSSGSMIDILQRVSTGELRPLGEAAPDAPPELEELVELTLSMDPARRPTAAALAARLDAWLREGRAAAGGRGSRALSVTLALAVVAVVAAVAAPLARRARSGASGAPPATTAEVAAVATRLCAPDLGAAGAALVSSEAEALAARGGEQAGALLLLAGEAALRAGDLGRAGALRARAGAAGADARDARALDLGLAALASSTSAEALEAAVGGLQELLRRRPGRADVRAWSYLAAGRLRPAAAGKVVAEVPPDGVPPALHAGALLAAGRLAEAAALASSAAPGEVPTALRVRLAWASAGAALASVAGSQTLSSLEGLERALDALEELPRGSLAEPLAEPERTAAVEAARRALASGPRSPDAPRAADLGYALRRHLALHTVWRLAEPDHRAPPGPEVLTASLTAFFDRGVSPYVGGPGGRRRMARAIALAPDSRNAYLMAVDLSVVTAYTTPYEAPDPPTDLAWIDKALELSTRPGETGWEPVVRLRAEYLGRIRALDQMEAWCGEVERRWGTEQPELLLDCVRKLAEAYNGERRLRDAVRTFRRAQALSPGNGSLRVKVSVCELTIVTYEPATAEERAAAVAEAEAVLADPSLGDGLERLKHAEALALLQLWHGTPDGRARALALLRAAMPGWTSDQLSAAHMELELMLQLEPGVDDPAVAARWSAVVEDLARRLRGDIAYQDGVVRDLGDAAATSARIARVLRGHEERTLPEIHDALRRRDLQRVLALVRGLGQPRPD